MKQKKKILWTIETDNELIIVVTCQLFDTAKSMKVSYGAIWMGPL